MLGIFFISALFLLIFASAGRGLAMLLRVQVRNPFMLPLLGMFVFGLIGMALALVGPLTVRILLLCLTLCLPGGYLLFKSIRIFFLKNRKETLCWLCVTFFILALCAFATAFPLATAYDLDLYHIQIIRWLNEYGLVPGIGNLHSRLAIASSWLTLAALINHGPLNGSVPWLLTPMLLTSFIAYMLWEIRKGKYVWIQVYACCLLPLGFIELRIWAKPNLYFDAPALLMICIVGCELLYFVFDKRKDILDSAIFAVICVTQAFLMKPLALVGVFVVSVVVLFYTYTKGVKNVIYVFWLSCFAAIIWGYYHYVSSGWPFFPATIFPFDVDWAMSEKALNSYTVAVRGWARWPASGYQQAFAEGIAFWFPSWFAAHFGEISSRSLSMLLPLVVGTYFWVSTVSKLRGIQWVLLCWAVGSIVFWFWLAPDPRFGREFFWLYCALGGVCWALHCQEKRMLLLGSITSQGFLRFYMAAVLCCMCFLALKMHGDPGTLNWSYPGKVAARPVKMTTISAEPPFTIYVPETGDQCGDAPLPCAPSKVQGLHMRETGNLAAGFKIEH